VQRAALAILRNSPDAPSTRINYAQEPEWNADAAMAFARGKNLYQLAHELVSRRRTKKKRPRRIDRGPCFWRGLCFALLFWPAV
jgi:hypothetical protein